MNDKQLIEKLGGVDVLSKHLNTSYQRVFNWTSRGIPAQIKVEHPDLFLTDNPPRLDICGCPSKSDEGSVANV